MASHAIVQERTQRAVLRMKDDVNALAQALSIDATGFGNPVKGDAPYQEMVRAEETAKLLSAIRQKVAPATEKASAQDTADDGQDDAPAAEGEEQTFRGHKLSEFDGKSDEDILAIEGIGQGTLDKIRAAQAERDAKK